MEREHPKFLTNGMKKAEEKQDFAEFNKELTNGMNYWVNLLNKEIGSLDMEEAPLVIAALKLLVSVYEDAAPGAEETADIFYKNTKAVVMVKAPRGN